MKLKSVLLPTALFISVAFSTEPLTGINELSYTDVVYTSRKDTVITSAVSGNLYLEVKDKKEKKLFARLSTEVHALAYAAKQKKIFAAAYKEGIKVIEYPSGKILQTLHVPGWCISLDIDKEEKYLAAGCANGKILIWHITDKYRCDTISGKGPANALRFYNNSANLAVAAYSISVWDINTRKEIKKMKLGEGAAIRGIDIHKEGKLLAGASLDKVAGIFRLEDYALLRTFTHPDFPLEIAPGKFVTIPPSMAITCSRFTNDRLITAGGDRTLRVWDYNSGKLVNTFTGHKGAVSNISVSADEKQVASVDLKGRLIFWTIE